MNMKYSLPLLNEEYNSNNLEELKSILFEYMESEECTDFTHSRVFVSDMNSDQLDKLGYEADDLHGVLAIHFYGNCFIKEMRTLEGELEKVVEDSLIYLSLDDTCLHIQTYLGVDDGFSASIFFSGIEWNDLAIEEKKSTLLEYIKSEIKSKY